MPEKNTYVIGTYDTKGPELHFINQCLKESGLPTTTVDVSARSVSEGVDVGCREVASFHPDPEVEIFTADRGMAVSAMSTALVHFMESRKDVAAIIAAGGSGAASLVTPAMRVQPPEVICVIHTSAMRTDIDSYIGDATITVRFSPFDIAGLNSVSRQHLRGAANCVIGMSRFSSLNDASGLPAIGITTSGITADCQERVMNSLAKEYDCIAFHAAGSGGTAMEKMAEANQFDAVVDMALMECTNCVLGGRYKCTSDRFDRLADSKTPAVIALGGLCCMIFDQKDTVPDEYRHQRLFAHTQDITLVCPTAPQYARIGQWLGEKLSAMKGPTKVLLPDGGTSSMDVAGGPFYDPEAQRHLFDAFESTFKSAPQRDLIKLPYALNDKEFADEVVANLKDVIRPIV